MPRPSIEQFLELWVWFGSEVLTLHSSTEMTHCSPMKNKRPIKIYTKSQANNHIEVFNMKDTSYTNNHIGVFFLSKKNNHTVVFNMKDKSSYIISCNTHMI